jgi:anaerobic selenocysteine-containing dehydrogenase
VFRELGALLDLNGEVDETGEVGGLMEIARRLPERLAPPMLEGKSAAGPADGRPIQFIDVLPLTADQRVHLYPDALAADGPLYAYRPDPATDRYPLSLISPASERTISSTLAELRPGVARLRMHPEDASARSITEGDPVRIFNELGEVHCEVSVTPEVRPRTVSLPKGLWSRSTFNGATANALVPDSLTDLGAGACFNDARVQVELLARH